MNKREKGKDLIFISWILMDGSGVEEIEEQSQMAYLDNATFKLSCLSIKNRTWIACEFNSYVVKLKPNNNA